ncbi:hypothetical protein JCM12107_03310 [Corynebacterium simulans]
MSSGPITGTNSYTTLTDAIADGYAIEKHALTVQLTAEDARDGGSEGVAKPACLNVQFIAQHRHDLAQAATARYQRTTNTLQIVLLWGK